jgi:hypothetical protein
MEPRRVIFAPEAEAKSSPFIAGFPNELRRRLRSGSSRRSSITARNWKASRSGGRDAMICGRGCGPSARRVTIAFAIEADTVTIFGVFYGGQDFESALHIDEP